MDGSISSRSALFWFLQRITGLVLAVFLFTHIKVLHFDFNFVERGLMDFNFVIERLKSSIGWGIFYFCFILSALFHGLNGLWAVIMDFRPTPAGRKAWLAVIWILGIAMVAWSISTLSKFYGGGA
jgi:succinate dehydrogenase / fumarate reductase membrane anchor subunit